MAKLTGKDIAMTVNSVVMSAMRGWSYEETDVDVDSTAAGDAWIDRDSLRGDYTIEANALVTIATPYVLAGQPSRGAKVTWVLETVNAHTNNILSGTGKVGRCRLEAAYDGMFMLNITINSAGTAPTWVLTGT